MSKELTIPRELASTSAPEEIVAVVGLGYVGLPLALALGRSLPTIGIDIDDRRIAAYQEGRDPTTEVGPEGFSGTEVDFCTDPARIAAATIIIVAVPTPIDGTRRPDLSVLKSATEMVGRHMTTGCIVVFESTVYPGATEEICQPILERASGLRCGRDFHLGYSPERINPGDVEHSLASVIKVVAAQTEPALDRIDRLYRRVVTAGTHRAPSIRVAEASKVLENTQRDLNIALMNELALVFERANIDTHAVIDAASTKWNFVDVRPGLVGGHCIGVDPYYLTHLAETLGYHPDVILAGRRVNDSMGHFVGRAAIKELIAAGKNVAQAKVAILGVTFKENVADLRNSRTVEVVRELREHGVEVVLCDPQADPHEVEAQYGVALTPVDSLANLDGIVAAVCHREYRMLTPQSLRGHCRLTPVLLDVRAMYEPSHAEQAGFRYWRL
ncbi:MAG: nucleotide sugar dehydrogenase [Deltaproteobacteria bacterium]|nr:nucleotide sugar dehydrogenase [Deltaproteobacteria bacterium]